MSLESAAAKQPEKEAPKNPLDDDGPAFKNGDLSLVAQGLWSAVKAPLHVIEAPFDATYHAFKDTYDAASSAKSLSDEAWVPVAGVGGAIKAGAGDLWSAVKDVGSVIGDGFDIVGHTLDAGLDVTKAAGNVGMAVVDGIGKGMVGAAATEVQGWKELAHGEIGSGLLHTIASPIYGVVDGVVGAAERIGDAGVNLYHAAENII